MAARSSQTAKGEESLASQNDRSILMGGRGLSQQREIDNPMATLIGAVRPPYDMPIAHDSGLLVGRAITDLDMDQEKDPSYTILLSLYKKTKREKAELAAKVDQLDTIHRELHHRTKNNFRQFERFIRAALSKENRSDGSALRDILARVDSMAALHGQLYEGPDVQELDFGQYLLMMHQRMEELYDLDVEININCSYRPDSVKALQLSLIVNEMMTNAFKYAFSCIDDPICRIYCHERNGLMTFRLSDNGGPTEKVRAQGGFGSRLIAQLTEQLEGTHHCTNDAYGTTHHLTI